MNLEAFNTAEASKALKQLLACCASKTWAKSVLERRPFSSSRELFDTAEEAWSRVAESDILEAFAAHPQIGTRTDNLTAQQEQASTQSASKEQLLKLSQLNKDYFEKFGFIFIVCASGKSTSEMTRLLETRFTNSREEELRIAATEQMKITRLRLERL